MGPGLLDLMEEGLGAWTSGSGGEGTCYCDRSCFPENSFIKVPTHIVNSQNCILPMVIRVDRSIQGEVSV